jgi:hypothetical protein
MNRFFLHVVLAAVPLSIALGAPSHAQYTGDIPELSRATASPMIQLKAADLTQTHFTEVRPDQKLLDNMSESSTVRVACGVGIPAPVLSVTAPGQTVDQKLFIGGLCLSFVGGFILAIASFFTLRWKTFGWRASRASSLLALGTFGLALPMADPSPQALNSTVNVLFPFVAAIILAPKQVWMLATSLKPMFKAILPFAAPVAAVAALLCGIFAWTTGQHDRLAPVRKVQTRPVVQPVQPIAVPPVLLR